MLTPEHVKSFITHPETIVSNAAIDYFSESILYKNDASLMALVLQKLEQVKQGETFHLFRAYRFQQSEESIQHIMELLLSEKIDPNTKFHLAQILLHSDLPLLTPYMSTLSKQKPFMDKLQQRMDIQEMANDVLFQTFEHFVKNAYGKYYNEIDTFYGDRLVEELGKRRCLSEEHILHELDSYNPDNDSGYDIIYYTMLAGEMQLAPAIPMLCGFLGDEDDLLPGKAAEALVQIGSDAVITALTEQYLRKAMEEKYFGLFASDVFGKIKTVRSEDALLTLLPKEQDLTNATILASGLCELGSVKGIPMVRMLVKEGYDRGFMNLKEALYAHCVISGQHMPEIQTWKEELQEEERELTRRQNSFFNPAPQSRSEKIGRNDPCPCGSGKKYKKCCGSN